jgi:hypothetical protein
LTPTPAEQAEKRATGMARPTRFALIIGGMKCGTTSLFELLAQHPEVCPSREKEPDFFANESDPISAWDRYLDLWNWDPRSHSVALEASTTYAKYPWVKGVPERIASSPGEFFQFIYLVRDPVKRIASQVRHGIFAGWGGALDEGLGEDLIDFSRYAMQASRYASVFGRERILILTLEELRNTPEAALRRVCEFLAISAEHEFEAIRDPRNVGDFYTVPPIVAGLARNRVVRNVVNRVLSREIRHRLRRQLARLGGGRDEVAAGRWELNADETALVRARLADDMAQLRDDYDVEASWLPARSASSRRQPDDL